MNADLVLLAGLAVLLSSSVESLALQGERPKAMSQKHADTCWPGETEVQNPNVGKHRPSRLPRRLANARVRRSVMLLKRCVSETGDVARVLVLESSGNPDVDKYYTTELSKWTFTPVNRQKRKVRSVVSAAVTLYIK